MVLFALAFWGLLWGVTGAFLSTPLTVLAMVILAEFASTRWLAVLPFSAVAAQPSLPGADVLTWRETARHALAKGLLLSDVAGVALGSDDPLFAKYEAGAGAEVVPKEMGDQSAQTAAQGRGRGILSNIWRQKAIVAAHAPLASHAD